MTKTNKSNQTKIEKYKDKDTERAIEVKKREK